MPRWLSRLFGRKRRDESERRLQQLVEDLRRDSAEFPIEDLRPVLVPSAILSHGKWFGPHHHFQELPVSLTWAFLRPRQTMVYLTSAAASKLEASGTDWRKAARDSLRADAASRPWSHEVRDREGELRAVGLLHEDGLGPSRLICVSRLLATFPEGFTFYVPERSAALVMAAGAADEVVAKVTEMVAGLRAGAEVPMSDAAFTSDRLRDCLESVGECA